MKYKGTVEVPNLSDENDMEDLDVRLRWGVSGGSGCEAFQRRPALSADLCSAEQR